MRLALAAIALAACSRSPAPDPLRSNFASVRVEGGKILDGKSGAPYTGDVIAHDGEVAALANLVLGGTEVVKLRTAGMIVVVPVAAGVPSGRVQFHLDLRTAKLDNEITKIYGQVGAAIAREVSPTLEVGEATLQNGALTGTAVLLAPSVGLAGGHKLAYARFRDNKLDGDSVEYYPGTDQAHHERRFAAGQRTGKWKTFFRDGSVAAEMVYDADALHGPAIEHYANRALRSRRSYDHGRPTGTAETWYPSGARKETITYAADGTSSGTAWYSTGAISARWGPEGRQEVPAEGAIEDYFGTGEVERRTHYTAGVRDGAFEVFYPRGKRRESGTYERGVQTGAHRKWWPDGKPALEATYQAGVLTGAYKRWYADGTPWEDATYVAGKLDGRYRKWWRNGVVAHDYRYAAGKLDGPYRRYYDTGQLWMIGDYDRGKPRGVLLRWFPGGQRGYELHHRNGRPHGPYRRWYANGTSRLLATYADGQLDGDLQNWLEDGSLYERATYRRGEKLTTTLAPAR